MKLKIIITLVLYAVSKITPAEDSVTEGDLTEALPNMLNKVMDHTNKNMPVEFKRPEKRQKMINKDTVTQVQVPAINQTLVPEVRHDPFQVSALMQKQALFKDDSVNFVASSEAKVPMMQLRGLINNDLALLEINRSNVFLVRSGDTISLAQQGQNVVVKIEKIDKLSLQVKVGTLQEVVIVR